MAAETHTCWQHPTLPVQADDARFVNASMSFNTQTLRPKYQLLWGSSGKSNALAVAEGLRFDPLVLQEAAEIARGREVLRLKPGDAGNSVRAQAMQVGVTAVAVGDLDTHWKRGGAPEFRGLHVDLFPIISFFLFPLRLLPPCFIFADPPSVLFSFLSSRLV